MQGVYFMLIRWGGSDIRGRGIRGRGVIEITVKGLVAVWAT